MSVNGIQQSFVEEICGLAVCCARAANGHAAAPPSSVMTSRRFIIR
jgi:hypothetical protein